VSLAIRETRSRASRFGLAQGAELRRHRSTSNGQSKGYPNETTFNATFLFSCDVRSSFPPGQYGSAEREPDNTKTTNQSVDALRARPEASETQCCKSVISEGQPILQPGTLPRPVQAPIKPWSMPRIPTDTPSANRKSWIGAGPGSLPLAVAVQPDVTQKYGTSPGVLQVYFGHRQ
jgi:hypothetical protein